MRTFLSDLCQCFFWLCSTCYSVPSILSDHFSTFSVWIDPVIEIQALQRSGYERTGELITYKKQNNNNNFNIINGLTSGGTYNKKV